MEESQNKCPICGNSYKKSVGEKVCPDCEAILELGEAMRAYLEKTQGKRLLSEGRNAEEENLLAGVNERLTVIHVGLLPHLEALESLYDVFYTHELVLDCPPYKVSNVPYLGLQKMHEYVYGEFLILLKPFLDENNGLLAMEEALNWPSSIKVFLEGKDGKKEDFPRFDASKELKKASSLLKDTLKVLEECPSWGKDLFTFMGDRYRFKGFENISLAKLYRAVYSLDAFYRCANLSLSPEATLEFASMKKIVGAILAEAVKAMEE